MFLTDEKHLALPEVIVSGNELGASDIDIAPNKPVIMRVDGRIAPLGEGYIVKEEDTVALLNAYLSKSAREKYENRRSYDTSIQVEQSRTRLHFYESIDGTCLSCRLIPPKPRKMDELLLPPVLKDWVRRKGIIVISGLTNTGKTTTLASLVDYVNSTRNEKIMILEDPIEFIHTDKKSCIFQREIGMHSPSYADALKDVARENTDIVVVGEVRSKQAMDAVFSMAEAGLSVFTSVHANSAMETVERIVNLFPPLDYERIYHRMSWTLVGIANQELLPRPSGGRVLACEIVTCNQAVKNALRTGKIHNIQNLLDTGGSDWCLLMPIEAVWKRGGCCEVSKSRTYTPSSNPSNRCL